MAASTATTFRKLQHREHVLLRPGMYIGSVQVEQCETWVLSNEIAEPAAAGQEGGEEAGDADADADADAASVKSTKSAKSSGKASSSGGSSSSKSKAKGVGTTQMKMKMTHLPAHPHVKVLGQVGG